MIDYCPMCGAKWSVEIDACPGCGTTAQDLDREAPPEGRRPGRLDCAALRQLAEEAGPLPTIGPPIGTVDELRGARGEEMELRHVEDFAADPVNLWRWVASSEAAEDGINVVGGGEAGRWHRLELRQLPRGWRWAPLPIPGYPLHMGCVAERRCDVFDALPQPEGTAVLCEEDGCGYRVDETGAWVVLSEPTIEERMARVREGLRTGDSRRVPVADVIEYCRREWGIDPQTPTGQVRTVVALEPTSADVLGLGPAPSVAPAEPSLRCPACRGAGATGVFPGPDGEPVEIVCEVCCGRGTLSESMVAELVEELLAKRKRLQEDPGGSDIVDQLQQALQFARAQQAPTRKEDGGGDR